MIERTANSTVEIECPQCGAPVAMPGYADMAVCAFCGSTLRRERRQKNGNGLAGTSAADQGVSESPLADEEEEEVLRSVQCSQCAGPLKVRGGRRILECRHCGVRVMVRKRGGVSRWYFPTRLSRLKAASVGAEWLRTYPGIAGGARDAQFVDAQLVYAPIWEHRALVTGWEFGRRYRTVAEFVPSPGGAVSWGIPNTGPGSFFGGSEDETGRLELQLAEENVSEARLQERRYYKAATDFGVLGATRPRVSGRELLVPLLAGELDPAATVLQEEGTAEEIADKGRSIALRPLTGVTTPNSHLFTFRESTALLYYPLWLIHFRSKQGSCRLVVNGRFGNVNSAVAPADNSRRIALLAAQAVAIAVVVAIFIWLAATMNTGRASFIAAAAIVAVIDILWVWRFRMVGEVEYREPFSS